MDLAAAGTRSQAVNKTSLTHTRSPLTLSRFHSFSINNLFCLFHVAFCQVGGLLLVVPEHRLSLELKWHELRLRGDAASLEVCEELQALVAMPYLDMLDESDELLHHRWAACQWLVTITLTALYLWFPGLH